jgi:hypothetical protein
LVNKVEITPSRIITRDSSGNSTFDTNNLYLKTDPTGSMQIGGYTQVPGYRAYFLYTQEGIIYYPENTGYAMTLGDCHNYNGTVPATNAASGYYSFYAPAGITEWISSCGITMPQGAPLFMLIEGTTPMGAIKYKNNYGDTYADVGTVYLKLVQMVFRVPNQQGQFFMLPFIEIMHDEIVDAYNTYGEGYYQVYFLSGTNWFTANRTWDQKGWNANNIPDRSSFTVNSYNTGTKTFSLSSIFDTNSSSSRYWGKVLSPFVLPKIEVPPTNIGIAVTP